MGLEPKAKSPVALENQRISEPGAPKASPAACPPVPADEDLAAVVGAWPDLPAAVKAGIVAMVKASGGTRHNARQTA